MTNTLSRTLRTFMQALAVAAVVAWSTPAQAQEKLFYTETGQNLIGRATLTATPTVENSWITLATATDPIGITTDNTYVYWVNFNGGSNQTISRVAIGDPGGTGDYTWITLPGARSLAFSPGPTMAYIYVACPGANKIVKVDRVTGAVSDVVLGIAPDRGIAVDENYIYWGTSSGGQFFYRCPIAGGTFGSGLTVDLIADVSGYDGGSIAGTITITRSLILFSKTDSNGVNGKIYTKALDNTGTVTEVANSLMYPDAFWAGLTDLYFPNNTGIYSAAYGVWTPQLIVTAADVPSGIAKTGPTATVVTLTTFTAQAANGKVNVAWTTGSEVNAAGFNIHRATSVAGPFVKVNAALIPATGTNVSGASYAWTDASVTAGTTYFYKLEDVDTTGASTFHGPVSALAATSAISAFQATPASIFLGGGSLLSWTLNGASALLDGAAVTGASQWVAPTATRSYTLTAGADSAVTTVTVKTFGLDDMAGLAKAWGHRKGEAAYDPSYDLNGDGKVDDTDAALCFKGL